VRTLGNRNYEQKLQQRAEKDLETDEILEFKETFKNYGSRVQRNKRNAT